MVVSEHLGASFLGKWRTAIVILIPDAQITNSKQFRKEIVDICST